MRFELVPKKMKEEVFWRNYFYRVSLIKQSYQLRAISGSKNSLDQIEASSASDLPGNKGGALGSKTTSSQSKGSKAPGEDKSSDDDDHADGDAFASNEFDAQVNADELQAEMAALGMDDIEGAALDDNVDWEKELAEELNEYEVVEEKKEPSSGGTSEGWEKEVSDMLKE